MKYILACLLLAGSALAQPAPKVDGCTTVADKTKNIEAVRCDGEFGGIVDAALISVTRVYPPLSDTFGLKLLSTSRSKWKLRDRKSLLITADGVRMDLGPGKHAGDVYGPIINESLFFTLSRAQLDKIAEAESVELRVATVDGKLSSKMLKKLRALAAATR